MLEFDMSDFGLMYSFLGLEEVQSTVKNFIFRKKYVQEILKSFQVKNWNSITTPVEIVLKLVEDLARSKVGSTLYKQIVERKMYLAATQLDITHSVSLISWSMEHPREIHLLVAKRVLRYVQGAMDFGLLYKKEGISDLLGFSYNDYAGDSDDQRSTSSYVLMIGSTAILWSSKKQPLVTLSTTEAKFVATTFC